MYCWQLLFCKGIESSEFYFFTYSREFFPFTLAVKNMSVAGKNLSLYSKI